jgi:AraC family transcriptional regulator
MIGHGRFNARELQNDLAVSRRWCDGQIVFDHRRWSSTDADLRWSADRHLLVLTETGGTAYTEIRINGCKDYVGQDRPGALTLVPAHLERRCAYRLADMTFSALWVDESFLNVPVAARTNVGDPVVRSLISSLSSEVIGGREPTRLYLEHMLALVLMRMSDARPGPTDSRGHPLSRRSLRRVVEFVEENLHADLSVAALAGVAEIPPDGFARRFKASTGSAPHAYVIARRIRRAEALLAETDQEIGAIAVGLGFSSQAHLSHTFRRLIGTTPAAYRKEHDA